MIDMLKNIKLSTTEEKRQEIDILLEKVEPDVSDASMTLGLDWSSNSNELSSEAAVSAEVGPNNGTDTVDEDFIERQDPQAVGYIGKGSEADWLRCLQEDINRPSGISYQPDGVYGSPGDSTEAASQRMEARKKRKFQESKSTEQPSTSKFFLDVGSAEVNYTVDPFEIPPLAVAQNLLDVYMETVQDSFPILSRQCFTSQFRQYFTSISRGSPLVISRRWLAILNLVFAIGTRYLHLTRVGWLEDDQGHQIFQSRAQILGFSGPDLVSLPDLLQIQITVLLAFYFFSVGHINRAWAIVGTAIRFAHGLGLHVRNEHPGTSNTKRETLVRMWWALYSLEVSMSSIIGRPICVVESHCSTPLPLPLPIEQCSDAALMSLFDEQHQRVSAYEATRQTISTPPEAPNAGSFLKHMALISIIMQRASSELYSASVVTHSWEHTQKSISSLCEQLDNWIACLPPGLSFVQPDNDPAFERKRLLLEMHYIRTKILVTRPCLCRLDSRIRTQSHDSDRFNKDMARACVETAKSMADILPEAVDATYLYRTGPWWSAVHNIMQALAVLLLEMSYGTVNFAENDDEAILQPVKKLVRWLRGLMANNQIAERAYAIGFGVLQRLAGTLDVDIADLEWEDAVRGEGTPVSGRGEQLVVDGQGAKHAFSFAERGQGQEFGEQGVRSNGFLDEKAGHAADFGIGGAEAHGQAMFEPGFGGLFAGGYDEGNPATAEEGIFGMNAFMADFPVRQDRL
ncbi:hypothetical protein BS50DRAFT_128596 [Corynespora cassiicola Philippines]|uniref:Xylanolytic transcriptional activator regulatory domain-containing protein n=1 Tax=Corynespora cassiicola Philippines TaxID=1448308 RepID=A0A2T2NBG9_CORCC|nr:hypothetical protein BS50DRAFT_128596 [Corynespora cassiicola Philippines]